jgi:hypothetical protein
MLRVVYLPCHTRYIEPQYRSRAASAIDTASYLAASCLPCASAGAEIRNVYFSIHSLLIHDRYGSCGVTPLSVDVSRHLPPLNKPASLVNPGWEINGTTATEGSPIQHRILIPHLPQQPPTPPAESARYPDRKHRERARPLFHRRSRFLTPPRCPPVMSNF